MATQQYSLRDLPSPYYRVATRAVILDNGHRILVAKNHGGDWELPGGGWEYAEPFDLCLEREIEEELGVKVVSVDPNVLGVYRGRNSYGMTLRIATRVTLASYDFKPTDMATVHFLTQDEFMAIDLKPVADEGMKDLAALIWP